MKIWAILAAIVLIVVAIVVAIIFLAVSGSDPKPSILILLDSSAGMEESFDGGTKIEAAVTAIDELIGSVEDSNLNHLALRQYGGPCQGENTELLFPFDEGNGDVFRNLLNDISAAGGTTLVSGVEASNGDFNRLDRPEERRLAFIVAGSGDSCQGNLSGSLQELENQGIEITFIGIGIQDNQRGELDAALAAMGGRIFFVDTFRELADVLSIIITELDGKLEFATAGPPPTLTPVPGLSPTPIQPTTTSADSTSAAVNGANGANGSTPTPTPPPTPIGTQIPTPTPVPPIITLLGSVTETIEAGSAYVDAGALALNNINGIITASIVIFSNVNTAVPGSYTVTYDVTDSAGNLAEQVVRTVNVVDTVPPVIALAGLSPVTTEAGADYIDAGATASDNVDGDITGSIATVNNVDVGVPGSYTVTYDVMDSSGNTAPQVTRTVNVVDTTPPVITILGSNPESVEVGTVYVDAGASASDLGDITASIVTINTVNSDVPGGYIVIYNVTDPSGNEALRVVRTVSVVDTAPPVITLLGLSPLSVEAGFSYFDAGAAAFDNVDGDITAGIVAVNSVNTEVLGSYTVTYDVTDSWGNPASQVVRTVNVVDTTRPVITLLGSDPDPVVVILGGIYNDAGASALDTFDGDITASIVTVNPVDTKIPETYIVTYNVTDASGNVALQVTRTVIVTEGF